MKLYDAGLFEYDYWCLVGGVFMYLRNVCIGVYCMLVHILGCRLLYIKLPTERVDMYLVSSG